MTYLSPKMTYYVSSEMLSSTYSLTQITCEPLVVSEMTSETRLALLFLRAATSRLRCGARRYLLVAVCCYVTFSNTQITSTLDVFNIFIMLTLLY